MRNKKIPKSDVEISEVRLENGLLIGHILDEFIEKLKEAREISSQLAWTSVFIKDKTTKEISEVRLENGLLIGHILDEFIEKLKEASEISTQLASTSIFIKDKTTKEIDVYINKIRNRFVNKFAMYPDQIVIQARAQTYVLERSLD